MRLDKFLANSTIGSRSEVKKIIKEKRVKVNDHIITQEKYQVDDNDKIYVDNQLIIYEKYVYYMLNKPKNTISSTKDKERTVIDLIDDHHQDLFPVGRLDKNTTGLLIITNDGNFAHNILSPKKHIDKTYYALIEGIVGEKDIDAFRNGLDLGDFISKPSKLIILNIYPEKNQSEIHVIIQEGKFHQVKRMFEKRGKKVLELKRISIGNLMLDNQLKEGEYRRLTLDEIHRLK